MPSTHEAQPCTKAVIVRACNHSPGEAGTGGGTGKSQVILGYQTSWRPDLGPGGLVLSRNYFRYKWIKCTNRKEEADRLD